MIHSDNRGLVLPPSVAPFEVVINPIFVKDIYEEMNLSLLDHANKIAVRQLEP